MDLVLDLVLWSLFELGRGTDGACVFVFSGIPQADCMVLVAWFSGVPDSAASLWKCGFLWASIRSSTAMENLSSGDMVGSFPYAGRNSTVLEILVFMVVGM